MSTILVTNSSVSLIGGVVNLHLEGTTDCHEERLTILILCDNQELTPILVSTTRTVAGRTWSADIKACKCGQTITVMAKCGAPNSSYPYQTISSHMVPCPGSSCCPEITTSVSLGECHSNGTRTVILDSAINTVKGCPAVMISWDFGNGVGSPTHTYPQNGDVVHHIVKHDFPCGGIHTATLHTAYSDVRCPSQTLEFNVPCCDCCPTLVLAPKPGPCDASGKRAVEVQYTITPSSNPNCGRINGTLTLSGLAPISIVNSSPLSGSAMLAPLPPGTYTATLAISSPSSCPSIQQEIVVPPCDCCPSAIVASKVDAKCNADHRTKHVAVTADIIPKPGCPPVTAVMSIDDTEVAWGSGSAPFKLEHEGDYGCGTHPVTVSYPGMKCPDGGGLFCVPACETAKCRVARNFLVLAATVSIISWALYLFSSLAGLLILAGSATIFTVIYYIHWSLCAKECRDCLCRLILWQIALASFAGLLMLSKSLLQVLFAWLTLYVGALPAVIIIVFILLLIAFIIYLLYLRWVGKCCPTECDKWSSLYEAAVIAALATGIVIGVLAPLGVASEFILPYATSAFGILVILVFCRKTMACAG